MTVSKNHQEFRPLIGALKQIQFWLESPRPPRIILATPTIAEFKSQKLPPHCKVTRRKIHGPRVPVRGRRQINQTPSVLAHWPKDGLVEGVAPTLLFVMSGEADIRLADYVAHCEAGDILFIPARLPKLDGSRPHYEKVTPTSQCDILMLFADPTRLGRVSGSFCHSRGDQHLDGSNEEACWMKNVLLAQLLMGLGEELQNKGNSKSTFHLLAGFIVLFQEEIENGQAFDSVQYPSDSPLSSFQNPIQHAQQYIQNHLDKPLSIDLVAHWVGLSRTVFTKRFRAETNESFKNYLIRLRLERAKVLLCQSHLPVERVSEQIGLTSCQLRNLFHQAHQCTPTQFRRSQKSGHN